MRLRPVTDDDRGWVAELVAERWGAPIAVSRGRVWQPAELPGFAAFEDDRLLGLVTYAVEGDACEIVTLDALVESSGVGTELVDAVATEARVRGCRRLWLITTNDNLRAPRFYQRRGFVLAALHRDALDETRRLKPSVPLEGLHGIQLRDELELERLL